MIRQTVSRPFHMIYKWVQRFRYPRSSPHHSPSRCYISRSSSFNAMHTQSWNGKTISKAIPQPQRLLERIRIHQKLSPGCQSLSSCREAVALQADPLADLPPRAALRPSSKIWRTDTQRGPPTGPSFSATQQASAWPQSLQIRADRCRRRSTGSIYHLRGHFSLDVPDFSSFLLFALASVPRLIYLLNYSSL